MKSKLTLSLAKLGLAINQRRSARIVALSLALAALLATGWTISLRDTRAQSGGQKPDPDYSQTADFTNGRTHLLRNDDLVMSFNFTSAGESRNVLFSAGTSNSNAAVLRYDQRVIPNGQAGCTDSSNCYFDYHAYEGATPATGRFFNTDRDTTVQYPFQLQTSNAPLLISLAGKSITTPVATAGFAWTSAQDISFVIGATSFPSAVGDFNGDGYDDLLMGYSNPSAFPSNPKLRIATAVDPNDSSKGFKFGPEFSISNQYGIRQLEVGDFDGDGLPEIVELYVAANKAVTLATFRVDPATLTISDGGQLAFLTAADVGAHPFQLVAGRFTTILHEQLVVGSQLADGEQIHVTFFDFAANSIQPQRVSSVLFPDSGQGIVLSLKAGRFNWSSPYDQIAWMSSSGNSGTRVSVLTVDPQSLTVVRQGDTTISDPAGARYIGMSMAVGNFDNTQPSAADPTKTERNPDLQIAVVGARANISNAPGQTGTASLYFYNVSEDYKTLTQASSIVLVEDFFGGNNILAMSIAASDMQGRSYRLGKAYKVTLESYSQPSVITVMPPMHVDYVIPSGGLAPTVLNLSAVPNSFSTTYNVATENNNQITTTNSESHSFGFKETVGASLEMGDVATAKEGTLVSDTVTATQDVKNSSSLAKGKFQGVGSSFSETTGWGDSVVYASSTVNIWVYEVIGHTVCPASKPNCQDSEKRPLTIQFSAPSNTDEGTPVTGSLKEWYQPVWEPGNVFSYPANQKQLQQGIKGSIDLLNTKKESYFTDSSSSTESTNWRSGVNSDSTVGQDKTFAGDNSLSVQGKGGISDVFTVGFDVGFDAHGSDAFSNLTQTTGSTNKSTGITFNKPGTFAQQALYAYAFNPIIFGTQQPVNFVDKVDLQTDIQTFGALRTAFTVDPTAPGSGGWWSQAYAAPDIALNHPLRWSVSPIALPGPGQTIPSNCLASGSKMDCLSLNSSTPANPWGSAFHYMRGFFISNANASGDGAQLQITQEGTKLALQSRVYNYSLTPLDDDTVVRVNFYGIPWRIAKDSNGPANTAAGNIFLIGQDVLNPIPAFDSSSDATNWSVARTTWDTTNLGDQRFVFFVVAWAEKKSDGSLVAEMPSHGLSAKPVGATYKTFEDLTKLEELVANPLGSGQVSFSNNIGFYNWVFYVEPNNAPPALRAVSGPAELTVKEVIPTNNRIKPGETIQVSAEFQTGSQPISGLEVYFYDGNPAQGGKAFDVERVPYIRANGRYEVNVNYRAGACGVHRLFIKAGGGRVAQVTSQSQIVQVECPTPVCVSQVCMRSSQYYSLNLNQLPKGMVTVVGNGLDTKVSTSDTARIRILLQGGTAAQQKLNQQYVATQLSLLGQPGGNQAALRSNLLCYKLNFQPTQLGTGVTLNPSMTLGELFDQVRLAGRSGKVIDQRLIANLLQLLNGDDPQGRCR